MLKRFSALCLAFGLVSIPTLANTTEVCPFKLRDFNENQSLKFISRYFEKSDVIFDGECSLIIPAMQGSLHVPLPQMLPHLRFYKFQQYNRLAQISYDFQCMHHFLFSHSVHLIKTLMQHDDGTQNIDTSEYWSALILYRFLSPAVRVNDPMIDRIDIDKVMSRLWNSVRDRSEIEELFQPHTIDLDEPHYIIMPQPRCLEENESGSITPNKSLTEHGDATDNSILDELEAYLKTMRHTSDDDFDESA